MSANNYRDCPKCGAKGTAREDYEIYSKDTTVYIRYSSGCDECDYCFKFEEEREIEIQHTIEDD
jgi:hypothetical protein